MILYLAAMGANAAHDGVTDAESLLAQYYARESCAEQQSWAKADFARFQSLSSDSIHLTAMVAPDGTTTGGASGEKAPQFEISAATDPHCDDRSDAGLIFQLNGGSEWGWK